MSELYKNKYRIPSARAAWHDYNGGAYFVTICTCDRGHYFGEIENGVMHLSDVGECVEHYIRQIETHNADVHVPLFVVMPNHVHLIVIVDETPPCRDVIYGVSTTTPKNEQMQRIANRCGRLSHVISRFKSAVSRTLGYSIWQPRFHEHIVRDHNEMNAFADYVENNVANWFDDEFYQQIKS